MTIMEFTIIPLDKGPSFSRYVAGILDLVDQSGLDYRLNPMGTVVEGEWDDLLSLLTKSFRSLESVSSRISLHVTFDHRKGIQKGIERKIKSVMDISERHLKT
ncbi:MAG: MTH1187 family thiamine-binding protein [Deltaproteobacteria bacterium]|nr:MTH1187 family thiamine-binding protein [Deltaproteobacteria bacterium]